MLDLIQAVCQLSVKLPSEYFDQPSAAGTFSSLFPYFSRSVRVVVGVTPSFSRRWPSATLMKGVRLASRLSACI